MITAEPSAVAQRRGFYAIGHRAGNNLHHLELALDAGVDAIECDLWHNHGKLTLRHERKLPALPVLYDRWYVRWSLGTLELRPLLERINFRSELFLDIKSATPRAAEAVLELYHDNASMMPRTRVSSKEWKVLQRIARANTDMEMYYSVGSHRALRGLLRRARSGWEIRGTSIRHTLLTPEVVHELHLVGIKIFAWTVNNPHRGDELRSWGVDGIIADNLEVFRLPHEREHGFFT
jgi:glycerophosphoryl diester phosphodiesterase